MKPSKQRVIQAVVCMGETIPFFPKGDVSDELIADCLLEFVGSEEQLEWLVRAAIRSVAKYEGMPQLRRLFCSKFPPADGIEPAFATSQEFLQHEADMEAQFRAKEMRENEQRLADYKRQAALEGGAEPFELPEGTNKLQ